MFDYYGQTNRYEDAYELYNVDICLNFLASLTQLKDVAAVVIVVVIFSHSR